MIKLRDLLNEAKNDDKYVVIAFHEKGGGFVMTKPGSKKDAEDSARSITKSSDITQQKAVKVSDARKIKGLVGKQYLNEELVNEEFTAISNKSGKTVVFKNKDSRDAAVKAGTHEVPEDEKGGNDEPKGDKPNMFSKDAGYDAPDAKSDEPTSSDTQNSMDDVALSTKEDGSMDWKSSMNVEKILNNMLGNDGGTADVNDNGAIEYTIPDKDGNWGKALYIGTHPDDSSKFIVSIESPYDTSYFDETSKEFDNEKDAMAYAAELAKKYEKDFANEGTVKLMNLLAVNEAKLLPKGTKVIITHPKFKGDRGMIIGTGLTNGDYQVQTNGSIKGIEPKYLKVDKPNTKKEERNLKNLPGVIKIDLSEALEVLQDGGVLESIYHLEIAVERLEDMIKDLKRKS